MKKQRWDVVIYEIASRKVESVIGKDMFSVHDQDAGSGRNTAELRVQTGIERCNDEYTAEMVPAGIYSVGNILPENP